MSVYEFMRLLHNCSLDSTKTNAALLAGYCKRIFKIAPLEKMAPISKPIAEARWIAIGKYCSQFIRLATSLIMARLLAPELFGLVGMASVLTGLASNMKNVGFNLVLMQKNKPGQRLLSTIFWSHFSLCSSLTLLILVLSPVSSWFYGDTRVGPIVACLSLPIFIHGFQMVPLTLLHKESRFRELGIIEICEALISCTATISLALTGFGIWSLVLGNLIGCTTGAVLAQHLHQFKPSFTFDYGSLKESLTFSLSTTLSNNLSYWITSADRLLLPLFAGPTALAFYEVGFKLFLIPNAISKMIGKFTLPRLCAEQSNQQQFAETLFRSAGLLGFLVFPVSLGIACIAEDFVIVILGEKWLPAIPALWLLAPCGAIQCFQSLLRTGILAKGDSKYLLRLTFLAGSINLPLILIGCQIGHVGLAASQLVFFVALFLYIMTQLTALTPEVDNTRIIKAIWHPLCLSLAMAFSVLVFQELLRAQGIENLILLCLSVILGAVVYTALTFTFKSQASEDFRKLIGLG